MMPIGVECQLDQERLMLSRESKVSQSASMIKEFASSKSGKIHPF